MSTTTKYFTCTETAKIIRSELKIHFPKIKFSVRSDSYAGGASIDIRWIDGPSRTAVDKVVKRFEGAHFDGMTDSKEYVYGSFEGEKVRFGSDYVMTHRRHSRAFVEAIVRQFCKRNGQAMLEITGDEFDAHVNTRPLDHWGEKELFELLDTDAKDMDRCFDAWEERLQRERAEWMAGEPERQRQAQQEREEWKKERREEEAREQRAQEERAKREQSSQRNFAQSHQRTVLSSQATALAYLGLKPGATEFEVRREYRNRVKTAADGRGGYTIDMDFLVKVKERALQDDGVRSSIIDTLKNAYR